MDATSGRVVPVFKIENINIVYYTVRNLKKLFKTF